MALKGSPTIWRLRAPLTAVYHQPWPASTAVAKLLDPSRSIEEENTPQYHPDRFYTTRLGDILNQRYQVVTKLGYGSGSTVWLARDLRGWRWSGHKFVAVKINATFHHSREGAAGSELAMLKRIPRADSNHEGWHFVRKLIDSFSIDGASGKHNCLVFEPLREPLWLYRQRFVGDVIPLNVFKVIIRMILQGLDYLHTECRVIHTDLKPDNVMVKIEDQSILERDARDEYEHPLPQKHVGGRIVYLSRNNYGQPTQPIGVIQITDFDLAVPGEVPHSGCIQAEVYRAPEVILDAGYSYSADIWSLGVMFWDLVEGREAFQASCIKRVRK